MILIKSTVRISRKVPGGLCMSLTSRTITSIASSPECCDYPRNVKGPHEHS